jgi:DNA-binding NarL/FixJ family response regulator
MKIRIVVVDDQESLREGVRDLLAKTSDIEVVAMAADGFQAIELTRAMRPDLVVMDVEMPRMNGIETTRRIVGEHPTIRVIALSIHADKRLVAEMRRAGASEYVLKDFAFELLPGAIRAAMAAAL